MRVPPRPASALYSDRSRSFRRLPAPLVLFLLSFGLFPLVPDVFHPDFLAVFLPFCRFYAVRPSDSISKIITNITVTAVFTLLLVLLIPSASCLSLKI